jgi:hypothetical protein
MSAKASRKRSAKVDRRKRERRFQLNFDAGSFSPQRLGVGIRIPKTVGPILPLVAATIHDPFGKTSPALSDEARDFAQQHGKLFELLTYGSVPVHELRHFHEFMATAYGSRIMFDHALLASLNASVLKSLSHENAVAVPLTSWETMPAARHKMISRQLSPATLLRQPPPLTAQLIEVARPTLASIESLSTPYTLSVDEDAAQYKLSFMQLLESGAMSCQIARLDATVGSDLTNWFCDNVRRRDTSLTYTHPWNLWFTLEKHLGLPGQDLTAPGISHTVRNAVSFFCLSARWRDKPDTVDVDYVLPPTSFMLLWHSLLEGVPRDEDVVDWLDAQARKHNMLTLQETAEKTVAQTEQWAEDLLRLRPDADAGIGPVLTPGFTQWFRKWTAAQRHLCGRIIDNPLRFFDPWKYFESLADLVAAPCIVASNADMSPWFELRPGPVWPDGLDGPPVFGSPRARIGPAAPQNWRDTMLQDLSPGIEFLAVEDFLTPMAEIGLSLALWSPAGTEPTARFLARKTLEGLLPHARVAFV